MTSQKLFLTSPYLILVIISFLALASLVFYLFQVEKLTKGSYLVKIYQNELKTLQEETLVLEKNETELFSLENIENKINQLSFVNVSEVKYISISYDYLVRGSGQ